VPAGIEQIVCRCLGKRRHCRYRDVAELALALRDYAPRRSWDSVDRIRQIVEHGPHGSTAPANAEQAKGEGAGEHGAPPWWRSRSSLLEAAEGLVARTAPT
jgi:hypothetical protein